MNGMHQDQTWSYTTGSDDYSITFEDRFPPTPTCAQISVGHFYEFDDQSHADVAFTECDFVDDSGTQRTDHFLDVDAVGATNLFARMNLVRAAGEVRVSNLSASTVRNYFFWGKVS